MVGKVSSLKRQNGKYQKTLYFRSMGLRSIILFTLILLTGRVSGATPKRSVLYRKQRAVAHTRQSKCRSGSSQVSLEDRGFTFHSYDLSAIRAAHDDGRFNPEDIRIKGHVYRVKFENAF